MIVRPKHHARALLLLVGALGGFFILRVFLIPTTFGLLGHYRYANLAEQRAKEVRHGGRESCIPCHGDRVKEVTAGAHAKVQCEACHGPVSEHADPEQVDGPEKGKIADMQQHKSWQLCVRCHQKLRARPQTHPQISVDEHLAENDAEFAEDVCYECHSPHSPSE